jgi:Mg2+/Co2+ transporter CorC
MKRDDIIRMAREAEAWNLIDHDGIAALERFAELVAAAEREACCAIVYGQYDSDNVAQRTVDAIRARSE